MAVAADGSPLPWYTYPAIRFLEDRIPAGARVFEFGMGNSTLWWSRRAARIVTCESDQAWFDRIAPEMPANVDAVVKSETSDAYVAAAADHGEAFDILVLDGRRRVECCRHSLPLLAKGGVVVWDNSDRPRYEEGYELLRATGFKSLPFWGMAPMNIKEACTSIFYRPDNCLGI
jgi:predicted O-methyltransferase YrrM